MSDEPDLSITIASFGNDEVNDSVMSGVRSAFLFVMQEHGLKGPIYVQVMNAATCVRCDTSRDDPVCDYVTLCRKCALEWGNRPTRHAYEQLTRVYEKTKEELRESREKEAM